MENKFSWLASCKAIKEIVVVDDNSSDNTIELCQNLTSNNQTVQIFSRELNNNFASQRNFGILKANYNWILWLDADERPSKKLIHFLNHFDGHQYKNYSFKRRDIFLKHKLKHGETAYLNFTRLFNKKYGQFNGQVHENWETDKTIKNTKYLIYHYSHSTIKSFIQKINLYSDIRANELFNLGENTNMFEIIFFPIGKFIQNYFLRLGFMDGTPGIIMALCMSFHVFLNKAKLWHLYKQQS